MTESSPKKAVRQKPATVSDGPAVDGDELQPKARATRSRAKTSAAAGTPPVTFEPAPAPADAASEADAADAEVAAPVAAGGAETTLSLGELFHRLYQVTYSKVLGIVIILVFAVLVLVGVIVDQAPAWGDAASRADFLTQAQAKYGVLTGVLSRLGAFHIFTSIGFFVVVAALAVSITGCTVHRLPQLWQRWRHPRTHVSERFFSAARYTTWVPTGLSPAMALRTTADGLRARHYRVIESGDNALYADKFGWGPFGTAVSHLSFLIIMAAFLVSGLAGKSVMLNVPIGDTGVPVGEGTNLTLKVTQYNQTVDAATGKPTDYVSHAILLDGGSQVAEHDIRVNSPLIYGKWHFHQYSPEGFAFDVTATSTLNGQVFNGSVPESYTSSDGVTSIGVFRIDSLGVNVQVETPASGQSNVTYSSGVVLQPGQVLFLVYVDGSDQPSNMDAIAPVDPGKSITYGDLTLTYNRETQYTGILVRTDPGTWLMWLGGILLVLGMTVTFMCRHQRLWIRAEDGRVLFASADKEDPGFRTNFTEITDQVPSWLSERSK